MSDVVSSLNQQATQSGGDEDSELHSKVIHARLDRVVYINTQMFLKTVQFEQINEINTSFYIGIGFVIYIWRS